MDKHVAKWVADTSSVDGNRLEAAIEVFVVQLAPHVVLDISKTSATNVSTAFVGVEFSCKCTARSANNALSMCGTVCMDLFDRHRSFLRVRAGALGDCTHQSLLTRHVLCCFLESLSLHQLADFSFRFSPSAGRSTDVRSCSRLHDSTATPRRALYAYQLLRHY